MSEEPKHCSFIEGLSIKAAEKSGLSGWRPWLFTRIEGGILCTGAVCPPVLRGKHKGEPNWRKKDPSTVRQVFVPDEAAS